MSGLARGVAGSIGILLLQLIGARGGLEHRIVAETLRHRQRGAEISASGIM